MGMSRTGVSSHRAPANGMAPRKARPAATSRAPVLRTRRRGLELTRPVSHPRCPLFLSDPGRILGAMTTLLAIGTQKGLFLATSDDDRRTWQVGPAQFSG